MLQGGGRSLEDLRMLRGDEGLGTLLDLAVIPSSDATGTGCGGWGLARAWTACPGCNGGCCASY